VDHDVIHARILDHRHQRDRHVLLLWKPVAISYLLATPTAARHAICPAPLSCFGSYPFQKNIPQRFDFFAPHTAPGAETGGA
jgi:hypothetical protein